MGQILEMLMVVCFGVSWPLSIYKSYKSRSTRGKSVVFLFFIAAGYLFGIGAKLYTGNITYVLFFYALNTCMVFTDIILYFRNKKINGE